MILGLISFISVSRCNDSVEMVCISRRVLGERVCWFVYYSDYFKEVTEDAEFNNLFAEGFLFSYKRVFT